MTDDARSSRIRRPAKHSSRTLSVAVSGCSRDMADLLERVARHVLNGEGARRGQLHIAVVGDAEMRRQHARWMNDPTPTDVLTFDLSDVPDKKSVDGQLIVCRSVARRAARDRGHAWQNELALYVVHGCLHLCGHDDCDERSAARMHHREDELL
jgi:probable rRNA maturation factor